MNRILYIFLLLGLLTPLSTVWSQNQWHIVENGDMHIPVSGGSALVHGDEIYIVGGAAESKATRLIQAYHPPTNTWRLLNELTTSRQNGVAAVYGDTVLICGGATDTTYSESLETWNFVDSPSILFSDMNFNRFYSTGAVFDSSLFLFGGFPQLRYDQNTTLPYIAEFHIPSRSFRFQESTLYSGNGPYQQMSARRGNAIYIFGGVSNNISNKVFRFEPASGKLTPVRPSLQTGRAAGAAVYCKPLDVIILLGGYNETQHALSSAEQYTLSTTGQEGLTKALPKLNYARNHPMAVSYGESVYVFGGRDAKGNVVSKIERLDMEATTGIEQKAGQPTEYRLYDNYPNPFNLQTTIEFTLSRPEQVRLVIHAVSGQRVQTLCDGVLNSGTHRYQWDGRDQHGHTVAGGVYFYRLEGGLSSNWQKMVLIK